MPKNYITSILYISVNYFNALIQLILIALIIQLNNNFTIDNI